MSKVPTYLDIDENQWEDYLENKYSTDSKTEQAKHIITDLQHYIECRNDNCQACDELDLLLEYIDAFEPLEVN